MSKTVHADLDLSRPEDRAIFRVRVGKEFSFLQDLHLQVEAAEETGRPKEELRTRIACTTAIANHRIEQLRPRVVDQHGLEQAIVAIMGPRGYEAANGSGLVNAHLQAIKRAFMAQPNDPERPEEAMIRDAMRSLDKTGRYPFYETEDADLGDAAPGPGR